MDIRKAIVFDMDGTMFDTEPISYHCWRDVSARHGFDLDRSVFNRMLGRDNLRIRAICDDAFGPNSSGIVCFEPPHPVPVGSPP